MVNCELSNVNCQLESLRAAGAHRHKIDKKVSEGVVSTFGERYGSLSFEEGGV